MIPSTTQSGVLSALRSFLLQVLPVGVEVLTAQQNRIPEPKGTDFVIMTLIRQERIETNVDTYTDAVFTGSIAAGVMTITDVNSDFTGKIAVGSTIFGVGVAVNTRVTALGSGTGGTGTYTIDPPQTISSEILAAGTQQIMQPTKFTVQLDFHSAPISNAGDMASVVSTLMRDAYAVQQFANQQPNFGIFPLYADDARQMPFQNDQQQWEFRWVVEALLQANIVISVPQQFAAAVQVEVISVEATYPP